MRVYIPSRGRGPAKQATYFALPETVRAKYDVKVVVPPDEVPAFIEAGIPVMSFQKVEGIAATRQAIITTSNDPKVLMLDDDLTAWSWRWGEKEPYHKASEKDIELGLHEVDLLLSNFAHVSIGHRFHANTTPNVVFNQRPLRALGYRADIINFHGLRFDEIPLMEDFWMALNLIGLGYASAHYYILIQDQPASNAPGGCSSYRTNELQAQAAHKLAERFPDIVALVKKKVWDGMDQAPERVDVRIQWQKWANLKEAGPIKDDFARRITPKV